MAFFLMLLGSLVLPHASPTPSKHASLSLMLKPTSLIDAVQNEEIQRTTYVQGKVISSNNKLPTALSPCFPWDSIQEEAEVHFHLFFSYSCQVGN